MRFRLGQEFQRANCTDVQGAIDQFSAKRASEGRSMLRHYKELRDVLAKIRWKDLRPERQA